MSENLVIEEIKEMPLPTTHTEVGFVDIKIEEKTLNSLMMFQYSFDELKHIISLLVSNQKQ